MVTGKELWANRRGTIKFVKNLFKLFEKKEKIPPAWMSHPDTAPELLPLAPLTVDDVLVPGETQFYVHTRTRDVLKCSAEVMEERMRQKKKRLAEEEIEKEKKEERREAARERAKQYGKSKSSRSL